MRDSPVNGLSSDEAVDPGIITPDLPGTKQIPGPALEETSDDASPV